MSRHAAALAAVAAMTLAGVPSAWAQGDEGPRLRARRLVVSAGAGVTAGYPIGEAAAELRANAPGTLTPPSFTLFRASTEVTRTAGVEARVAWPFTPSLAVEVGGAYSRPGLVVAISDDPEGPDVTLEDSRLEQYVVEAGLVWQVPARALGRRARPFVSAGGAYLRQLYDDRTRVETGQLYHAGAGVRVWLRGGDGAARDVGLRGEVRYHLRRGGVDFAGDARRFASASVALFVGL